MTRKGLNNSEIKHVTMPDVTGDDKIINTLCARPLAYNSAFMTQVYLWLEDIGKDTCERRVAFHLPEVHEPRQKKQTGNVLKFELPQKAQDRQRQFFSIMDNDRDLCLALLGPHGDMAFVEQIENLLAETFLKQLPDRFPKNDPNIKYPYAFILNGCVGLIRTWLSCPTNESPEQVARLIYRLIEDTTQGYLNMQK